MLRAAEQIAAALAAARARSTLADFIGELRLYCEHPDCAGRKITFRVKEDGVATGNDLRCPSCHRALRLSSPSSRWTKPPPRTAEMRASRRNVELYRERERRRLGLRAGAPVPVPVRILLDDSLPLGRR